MAEGGVVIDPQQFKCVVCLDVLKDPVTVPCGHNYCSVCIQCCWDQEACLGFVSCPQCRQTFSPRPVLARNTLLAKVVEKFKESGLQEVPELLGQSAAQPGDVECDVCIGRKNKAVNSCLVCLASYCELHVQPHHQSAVFSKHRLVSASRSLQQTICPRHAKLLEVYCRTDKLLICSLCLTDQHGGHDSVLVEAEVQQLQQHIGELKLQSQLKNQLREKLAQQLNDAIFTLARSAQAAVNSSDAVFGELAHALELKRQEVRDLIRSQEMAAVGAAEQLMVQIQKDIAEQKRKEADLDNLCQTTDHILFLQSFESLLSQADPPLPSVAVDADVCFRPVVREVASYKGALHDVLDQRSVSIYDKVKRTKIVVSPEPEVQLSRLFLGDVSPFQRQEATVRCPGLDQRVIGPVNTFPSCGPLRHTFNTWAT